MLLSFMLKYAITMLRIPWGTIFFHGVPLSLDGAFLQGAFLEGAFFPGAFFLGSLFGVSPSNSLNIKILVELQSNVLVPTLKS